MPAKTIGRYIVSDPAICHGEPTFRARTHSWLVDVLEQVESGMDWEAITEEWRGALERDAIAKSLFVWHVRRWLLMRPGWFRRWQPHDE